VRNTSSAELTAVVAALAGVRLGHSFTLLGSSPLLAAALSAAAGTDASDSGPVDVVVALAAYDVPSAVARLVPGGRLVALSADGAAAARTAELHGLALSHVAPAPGRVAWSAVRSGGRPSYGP